MKKIIAIVFMVALCAISCNKVNVEKEASDEYVQVSLGIGGEAPTITTSPMAKADEAVDWYQIQVYSAPIGETRYNYYGYGFFDNIDNMLINLKRGFQYKFVVDMIIDGSAKVYKFCLDDSGWAGISNSFFLSSDEHIRFLGEGYLYTKKDIYNRPDVDRFYGITEGYVPQSGGKVTVDMKRVSFGVKVVAKEFTAGQLEVQIDQAPTIYMDSAKSNEATSVISFNRTEKAYYNTSYSEDIAVNIILVPEDGVRIPLIAQDVPFIRNRMTTIEFYAQEPSQNKTFIIKADEEWEIGDTIVLDNYTQN